MQISDYMSDARSVALYLEKDPSSTFTYPSLGIADEVGELVDKISPELYDRLISNKEIAKEMGDVLWYINNTALDIGVSFCDIMSDIADGHLIHSFSDVYLSLRASKDQRPTMMKLAIYSGRIAGVAKKMIRDTSGELTQEKRGVVYNSLYELIKCLYEISDELGINMDDVAQWNLDKLFSRRDRGVLQGDGDNR